MLCVTARVGGTAPDDARVRLWAGLSHAGERLIAASAALLLVMVAAVGLAMWNMRMVALDHARENVGALGIAIAEQTARSIQSVDLDLLAWRAQILALHIATPVEFSTALRSEALEQELRQQAQALPPASAFSIVDASGKLLNFSRRWPIPPIILSDRDYFVYFRDHDELKAFVSAPLRNRGDGHWTIYVVRRIDAPGGQFLGMVLGAIDLDYFRNFYRDLTSGEVMTVALLERNGQLLVSVPTSIPVGQRLPPQNSAWDRIVASGHAGDFESPGRLVAGERMISVHPLRDYPLVVDVSVSKGASLANWRRQAILVGLGTASAVLCMALLLGALMLQLRRLERSEASLAERNARLEAARQRMEAQAAALRASQADLAETSTTLRTTLDHINQGIVMENADGAIAVCNQRALEMLELPAELMASRPHFDALIAYQRAAGEFPDSRAIDRVREAHLNRTPILYERTRPNGRILEVQSIPMPDGATVRTYTDVTERRRSEDQIRHLAHHDSLTDLANRTLFKEHLEDGIARADATGQSLALLYLDLDGFKLINDTRGHGAGDALLVQVAARLITAVGSTETVARTGGDEFAILMPGDSGTRSPCALAYQIVERLHAPFAVEGVPCRINVSIGIAQYPDHAKAASDLLRNADIALYQAKAEGTGLYRVFDAGMDARQQRLYALEQDLRRALERDQFAVVYQPIIDTRSDRAVGCEALLRWHHPTLGLVSPVDFIPLAEKLGLIIPIGRWVLETACNEAACWPADTHIAVNLSPVQVNHERLVAEVRESLEQAGLAPHRLTLEVTEGVMLEDSATVLGTMRALRAIGVRFSLDDFGIGHSGLGYLRRFPFDGIKIDKLFVQDMVDQPEAAAIVSALLAVSTALNLDVIAEGVETEAQMNALRRRHCRHVQGYFTGRPMDAAEARARIMRDQPAVAS
jgi:diguanylate cyclase (GGDEF)-like protein